MNPLVQTHKTYGLIIGLVLSVLSFGLYIAGLNQTSGIQYIGYLIFLAGIVMNAFAFSKANDHYVTFGNVFGSGFKASAIVALILTAASLIMVFVFPEMKDEAIEMARTQMEKDGQLGEDMIETSLDFTRKYFTPFMIAGAIFGTLFQGVLFSLIGAGIAKRKGPRNPLTAA